MLALTSRGEASDAGTRTTETEAGVKMENRQTAKKRKTSKQDILGVIVNLCTRELKTGESKQLSAYLFTAARCDRHLRV